MKTKIILLTLLTAMAFTCQNLQAQFNYGLHAGLNLQTQAELGQLWNNCELYQGYTAGGFLEYKAFKNISFQTELNYQKKGDKEISTVEGIESTTRREFNYLSVPVLIRGTINDPGLGDKFELTFFAGPYAGYLTSASSKLKSGGSTSTEDIENEAEKYDMGAIFGCGVNYKLANGAAIVAELRYEMGLTQVDKQDKDLRNKGAGITIGYRF
jgi:opacity protein-like surface antigen